MLTFGWVRRSVVVIACGAIGICALETPAAAQSPYGGTPASVPGTIRAENFDEGGEGVAYHDWSPGNAGGAYRDTDVDIAPSSEGGYTIGWAGAGEWLNYTVNVASAGSYTVTLRVASLGGGALHVGFNGPSYGTWQSVSVPSTGGWQNWTSVSVGVTLGAGWQQMTVMFDTGGVNLAYINIDGGSDGGGVSSSSNPPDFSPPPDPAGSGGGLRMMTWNVRSGTDAWENYVLPQQVQFMASQNPDVIVLQEVSTWNEWQPTRYRDLLQQATGQTWDYVWIPGTGCLAGGCIGEEILSRVPISDSATTFLGPSSTGRALIYVGGVPINILTCHLEAFDLGLRTSELYGLLDWARNFGGPRLVGGDFNSWWGEWWIGQMETEYSDTWTDVGNGQDGAYTIGNVRFDYIFRSFDGNWRATPTGAWVADTTLSDHRPFVADFRVQ